MMSNFCNWPRGRRAESNSSFVNHESSRRIARLEIGAAPSSGITGATGLASAATVTGPTDDTDPSVANPGHGIAKFVDDGPAACVRYEPAEVTMRGTLMSVVDKDLRSSVRRLARTSGSVFLSWC
jgi:hypothetical protein